MTEDRTAQAARGSEVPEGGGGEEERLRRWRMVLGGGPADGTGYVPAGNDAAMDKALAALYGRGEGKDGRLKAGAERGPGSVGRRRRWRAGWGTSGRTSPVRWCR